MTTTPTRRGARAVPPLALIPGQHVYLTRQGGSWAFYPTLMCNTHNVVLDLMYRYNGTSVRLTRRRAG